MSATENGHEPKRPLRDGIDSVREHVTDAAGSARDAASATAYRAHELTTDAIATGRDKASHAREGFAGGIEANPIVALAGGIALGVVVGALLPRSERESAVLGAVGAKLIDAAREAADAARETGRDKLDEAGLSRDGAREAVKGMLDAALSAAFSAGSAAADAAKQKVAEARN